MLDVLLQMVGLIVCGVAWKLIRPGGLDPVQTRRVLTSLVYYLLLPALVISVLWKAELGVSSLRIAAVAAASIVTGLVLGWGVFRLWRCSRATAGAMMLAAAFPNVTYMGLPVLEATFGSWARSVAIQYDLFASTPLLFTVGILVAVAMGKDGSSAGTAGRELLRIPALWAGVVAVALNLTGVHRPEAVAGLLELLERGVVPLMLFSLGLSLEWHRTRWRQLSVLAPVIGLRLFVVPALMLLVAAQVGLDGRLLAPVIMEAAMPSMVIGIVVCDRYGLDTALYAAAVTATTVLSLISLPLWFQWLA